MTSRTRAPRRRQDEALAAYLQTIARSIKEERFPQSQKEIAEELGIQAPQFTQALGGKTASTDVAVAFARARGVTFEQLRERAREWYSANRVESAAQEALSRCSTREDREELLRRIRALVRADDSGGESDSSPNPSARPA